MTAPPTTVRVMTVVLLRPRRKFARRRNGRNEARRVTSFSTSAGDVREFLLVVSLRHGRVLAHGHLVSSFRLTSKF